MAYRNDIPIATETLAVSQPQLLENFAQLNSIFGIDHVQLTEATNSGNHRKVTIEDVSTDPAQSFPASQVYTKHTGANPNRTTELFFSSKLETGADIVRQLTGLSVMVSGLNRGIKTPWGLTFCWGTRSKVNPDLVTFAIPFNGEPQSVVVAPDTALTATHFASYSNKTPTTVLIRSNKIINVGYFAIGISV